MARYKVQMTFETPGLRTPLKVTHRLPGRAASMRWLGGDGTLAVTARVPAETAADAAMAVVSAVQVRWRKHLGTLQMRSWTAHRERVLLGGRGAGTGWIAGNDDRPDEGGSAGVREPRRPLPGPGSLHAALDLPAPGLD